MSAALNPSFYSLEKREGRQAAKISDSGEMFNSKVTKIALYIAVSVMGHHEKSDSAARRKWRVPSSDKGNTLIVVGPG